MWAQSAARVAVVCAVLFGLFFMHGAFAAAGGCEGGAAVGAARMAMPPVAAAAGTHAARALAGAAAGHRTPAVVGGAVTSPRGMLCAATPPRTWRPGILLAVALGPAVLAVRAWRPGSPAGRARQVRAHPPPGPALLSCLCVSRT